MGVVRGRRRRRRRVFGDVFAQDNLAKKGGVRCG